MNRVFLDTEFTSLEGTPKLISVGMVCGENQFYVEVDGWKIQDCSVFTQSEVLNQLHGYQLPLSGLGARMCEFLAKQGQAAIAVDSLAWDWMWLFKYVSDLPSNIDKFPLLLSMNYLCNYDLYEELLSQQFDILKQHHALNDALAMQHAWKNSGGDIYAPTIR